MVLDDVVGYESHSFVCHVKLANVDGFGHGSIIFIVVALNGLDILNVESKHVVVEDSILDEVGVEAFAEQLTRGLYDLTFGLTVDLETRCSGEAEELCLCEVANDILMHFTELAAVTLVDDEHYLLITVIFHDLGIARILDGICHLLNRGDDELTVLVLHLLDEDIRAVGCIDRACFKLVEFLHRLRIQVLTVNQEYHLLDHRICR